MTKLSIVLLLLGLLLEPSWADFIDTEGSKDADFIDELPNQPESGVNFRQYSGYVTVDPDGNKRDFYYFVEAEGENTQTKPTLLFLGCHGGSSRGSPLLTAFIQVGPFKVESDGQTLGPNPFSWNKFANLLFLETPIGLGFTLTDNSGDTFATYDWLVSNQTYHFLLGWLQRFPEFKTSDIYIAGQEYIGSIGPQLANFILDHNERSGNPVVNLKGLVMGNPSLNSDYESYLIMQFAYRGNLMTQETFLNYERDCVKKNVTSNNDIMQCMSNHQVQNSLTYQMDRFSMYGKICPDVDPDAVDIDSFKSIVFECDSQSVAGYLNIPFVQRVMHVENPVGGPAIWTGYAGLTTWDPSKPTTMSDILELLNRTMRVLVYNGVLDYMIPAIANQEVIGDLGLTLESSWRPWFDDDVQIAGYTETYKEGLTYATVRNAGRKVSADQPKRGYIIAESFLANRPLPKSPYF